MEASETSERRNVPEPGEMVYAARPSWAPAFLALGILGLVAGVYAQGFAVPDWVYAVAGGILALLALRSIVRGAVSDFYRLPRRQRVRGAVLPVRTLTPPRD